MWMSWLIILLLPSVSFAESAVNPSKSPLPYEERINRLMHAVDYSALPTLIDPKVPLTIDFNNKTWTLGGVHQYDAKGNIILEQGRFGLCAELSTYFYQHLNDLPAEQYEFRFASATEAGFFPTYESNHIVLLLYDKEDQNIYLIDPSFHRYGKFRDFEEYKIYGVKESLDFMKDKKPDVTFRADQAMPLMIKQDLLLSFSVVSVDGKFDQDNFLFVITANRRHRTAGLNLLVMGKVNGRLESYESKEFLAEVLAADELSSLHRKITTWLLQH